MTTLIRLGRSVRLPAARRALLGLLASSVMALAASQATPQQEEMKVLDLVFTVKDLGGKVEDLRMKETATEIRIEMSADILFDFDRADVKPEAKSSLEKVADVLREHPGAPVAIEGHTDAKGSDAYNQKLSERRAASVAGWLQKKSDLKRVTFAVKGFGASRPVAPNKKPDGSDDPEGRQKNRRVEIVVQKR